MRHGTTTGYQYHGCRCASCTAAATDAHRKWRQGNAQAQGKDNAQGAAYKAAERTLRERHRAEFEALYAEEKLKRGLISEPVA